MTAELLAAGYATALAALTTEATEERPSILDAGLLPGGMIMVLVGRILQWVLHDLQDETSQTHGRTRPGAGTPHHLPRTEQFFSLTVER